MTMDQAEFTWDATPYAETESPPPATRRSAASSSTLAVLRLVGFLAIASTAILVLLPAAIAAQAALTV